MARAFASHSAVHTSSASSAGQPGRTVCRAVQLLRPDLKRHWLGRLVKRIMCTPNGRYTGSQLTLFIDVMDPVLRRLSYDISIFAGLRITGLEINPNMDPIRCS